MDMRHMVETHWTEQRSGGQLDYLEDGPEPGPYDDEWEPSEDATAEHQADRSM